MFGEAYGLDPAMVLDRLEERERLGSTGFGRGVAIPHARCPAINRPVVVLLRLEDPVDFAAADGMPVRSEEHTSELQSLMRISYAVFCLKKKTNTIQQTLNNDNEHNNQ